MTFAELLNAYSDYLKPKPSWQTYRFMVKQFFGDWTVHPTFGQLDEWHRSLNRTPHYANKGLSFLKAMYFWGMRRGFHPGPNPAVGIRQYKTFSRERVMTSAEVAELLRLCPTLPPQLHAVLVVLLTTGCRIGEALRMEASHVNVTTGFWVQPRTKNQKPHVTYLPTQAREALAWLPPGMPYVFGGPHAGTMYSVDGAEKAWVTARKQLQLEDVHLHDFRRTLATHLYDATKNEYLVKRCINHTNKDVTAIYVRISNDAVAQALQAQADRFFALIPHHLAALPPPAPPAVIPVPDHDIRQPAASDIAGARTARAAAPGSGSHDVDHRPRPGSE